MKKNVSVIITVRNEEKTITPLLESLFGQTLQPGEVVITDAESTDDTLEKIQKFAQTHQQIPVNVFTVKGNRSIGRNAAIEAAKGELIAVTDAGCFPRHKWLESLVEEYGILQKNDPVVTGYAFGKVTSFFSEAAIPFFVPFRDKIDPKSYLPTTRSVLVSKKRWLEVGKFNEHFNTSEDYLFSKELIAQGIPIHFAEAAVVEWNPPQSYAQAAKLFFTFATTDIEGGVLRPKVAVLFGRYFLGVLFLTIFLKTFPLIFSIFSVVLGILLYSFWAMYKHRRYVKRVSIWQPILQFTADFAVMLGSLFGLFKLFKNKFSDYNTQSA